MDKRKEEIIEVAIRRFSHYGFSKTTMNEIADDLKITKANLYYYYTDKAGLIKDVISFISMTLLSKEEGIVASYQGDILSTFFVLLKFRAEHMRKYYMLYINENLDWIKDTDFTECIEQIENRDLFLLGKLLSKAVDDGSLVLNNVEEASHVLRNILKGLGLVHMVKDVICGIPNVDNIDKVLDSQMSAIRLILEERIVVTNK